MGLLDLGSSDEVLDVACGTGLVSRWFKGKVARVVGVDMTPAMFEQARPHVDELVVGVGEDLPFEDNRFGLTYSRQGIQFMDDGAAVREMVRVTRPGGAICLIHLCAYGELDKDEYFEVLRLRNPVRRNFYLRGDLERLLQDAGCEAVAVHDHISPEDVDVWSDNGAIPEANREGIRQVYRNATEAFSELHGVELADGRIVDQMLFGIAIGRVPA
jgi:SAM-dependent methyltransferase